MDIEVQKKSEQMRFSRPPRGATPALPHGVRWDIEALTSCEQSSIGCFEIR